MTEVGVIPEDWRVDKLPNIAWFQEGPGLRNWQFTSSGVKVVNITNMIGDGTLDLDRTKRHISSFEAEKSYNHFFIDAKDILIASSGNSYCKTAVAEAENLPLMLNTSVIRFKPLSTVSYSYLWVLLNSPDFKNQIDLAITGGAQPNFGPFHLRRVKFPLPPTLAEQEAIAGALGDADAFIDSLEQLIAKKRLIKQGTMQDLLTAKKRLPGFTDDWVETTIKECHSKIWDYRGRTPRKLGMEWGGGPIRALSAGNVKMGKIDFEAECYFASTELYDKWMTHGDTEQGDILVTTEAPLGNVALVPDNDRYVLSQRTILLRGNPETTTNEYLAHLFSSEAFQRRLTEDASGSTAQGIQRLKFEKIELCLPSRNEQTAIARILSDMDAELEALEQKLAKARQLKQGMMQELLTGKTRLI